MLTENSSVIARGINVLNFKKAMKVSCGESNVLFPFGLIIFLDYFCLYSNCVRFFVSFTLILCGLLTHLDERNL